mmetsp:Transcript_17000/g.30853  ORF Transcript_17000/g.30853 Transcript_17000/m.30853 type:complete len:108 (+) Transcript_17000:194-517(+)
MFRAHNDGPPSLLIFFHCQQHFYCCVVLRVRIDVLGGHNPLFYATTDFQSVLISKGNAAQALAFPFINLTLIAVRSGTAVATANNLSTEMAAVYDNEERPTTTIRGT